MLIKNYIKTIQAIVLKIPYVSCCLHTNKILFFRNSNVLKTAWRKITFNTYGLRKHIKSSSQNVKGMAE